MRATLLALALAMATPALASDADDALLDQTPMLESAKAAKTAAILAYPAVCNSTVPMQVLEAAALMARAHGGPLLRPCGRSEWRRQSRPIAKGSAARRRNSSRRWTRR